MTVWRLLTVFFGLLITAPVVILNANGYNIAFWVDNDASDAPEVIIPPSDRPDVQAMFATDTLNPARSITITEVITTADLLQPDEVTPNDTLMPVYAAARAPARLIRYCDDVIATIGTTCDVIHTAAQENDEGKLELTGHLAFIPAYDMGDPYEKTDGALIKASIDLPHDGALLPANDTATRTAALDRIMTLCTQLRDAVGTCSVSQVTFTVNELWITDLEALPAGTNPQRLAVRADFTVFADDSTLDEAALLEQLKGLANPT